MLLKKAISLSIIISVLFWMPFPTTALSTDSQPDMEFLIEQGVISQPAGSIDHFEQPISRKQFAVLLAKILGLQPLRTEKISFSDCLPDDPACGYIEALAKAGLIDINQPKFQVKHHLIREDLAYHLFRTLHPGPYQGGAKRIYKDQHLISPHALPAVLYVSENGWMHAINGNFEPKKHVTIKEAASLFRRLYEWRNQTNTVWGITPRFLELASGQQQEIQITRDDRRIGFTPVFGWDHPEVGTISPDGVFTAKAPGTGLLTINIGNQTQQIFVKVHP